MAGNQGLSNNSNMSDEDRERIHAEGGKATGGSNRVITNKSGGGHLTKKDQRKGGQMSGGSTS
jgi:hypothetical protein